ncbi:hypothetical protein [Salinibacterium sp. ZJ454]|uniref:hypothetical protein n=1 Tax=Salinibacterium sp. ZJ454 TaxID=2708339 RepID=UPI0014235738|nr:hypothetical protein [Salinibacterium sp. ZJ454]
MNDTTEPESDAFDRRLDASAPDTSVLTPELHAEIARMAATAKRELSSRRPRHLSRAAIFGVAAVIGLGGVGAAAAATFYEWGLPWASNPDGIVHFTLPSGTDCELRVGNFGAENLEAAAAAREFAGRADILDRADVQGTFEEMRSAEITVVGGGETPGDDSFYKAAVARAVGLVISEELQRQGFDTVGFSSEGEMHCSDDQS